jgi:hypothetical protein
MQDKIDQYWISHVCTYEEPEWADIINYLLLFFQKFKYIDIEGNFRGLNLIRQMRNLLF